MWDTFTVDLPHVEEDQTDVVWLPGECPLGNLRMSDGKKRNAFHFPEDVHSRGRKGQKAELTLAQEIAIPAAQR